MIYLLLKDLKVLPEGRNIKNYENKSDKDFLNLLNDTNISIPKKKLKETEKDFKELRYNFSKKYIDKHRKSLYNIKNHGGIYTPKIRETEEDLSKLEESIQSIKLFYDTYNNESINDCLNFLNHKRLIFGFSW